MKIKWFILLIAPCLIVSCTRGRAIPSEIGKDHAELKNPKLNLSGVYPDGWVAASGSVELAQPPASKALRVRLMVPQTNDPNFRTTLEIRVDDRTLALRKLALGNFDDAFPLPESIANTPGTRRVTLAFETTQALPNGDGRQVGGMLQSIGFEKSVTIPRSSAEIAFDHVQLGSGWDPLETFDGETFRWVENNAEFGVELGAAHDGVLTMLIEPNLSAGRKPMLLRIMDQENRQAAAVILDQRRTFRVVVPLRPNTTNVFTLHLEGGGTRSGNDSRVLNFRVFAIAAAAFS